MKIDRRQLLYREHGSASIELVVAAPVIAIFIYTIMQLSAIYRGAEIALIDADVDARAAVISWDLAKGENGFDRPCIDMIGGEKYRSSYKKIYLGIGRWKRGVDINQEVALAVEPICIR